MSFRKCIRTASLLGQCGTKKKKGSQVTNFQISWRGVFKKAVKETGCKMTIMGFDSCFWHTLMTVTMATLVISYIDTFPSTFLICCCWSIVSTLYDSPNIAKKVNITMTQIALKATISIYRIYKNHYRSLI